MSKVISAAPGVKFSTVAANIGEMAVLPPPKVGAFMPGSRRILDATRIKVDDGVYDTSARFWSSLCARFGISPNIFNLFDHSEVFDRIAQRRKGLASSGEDAVRIITEVRGDTQRFLGLTGPNKPYVEYYGLMDVLGKNDVVSATYSDGVVVSRHKLANAGDLDIAGEKWEPRFCLHTPIDGYGNPSIYLELLRLICSNGATAMASAFRTEIPLGKDGKGDVTDAIVRMIQTYSNDEGFAAVSERFDRAARSWASIRESRALYQVLNRACPFAISEGDAMLGATQLPESREDRLKNMDIHAKFGGIVGDLVRIYGLTQVEGMSERRASTLPVKSTVYDLINFATEVATHQVKGAKEQTDLQSWVGTMLSREFDLEGSRETCPEFKDFFLKKPAPMDKKVKPADPSAN